MRFTAAIALIITCVYVSPAGSVQPEPDVRLEEAVKLAYEIGREDVVYETDDIGLVRLRMKDVEELIK